MSRDPRRKVREAYGDNIHRGRRHSRTLEFTTEWLSHERAVPAIRAVDRYNHFHGDDVAAAVKAIAAKDPNARFAFGRAGSPVLFVETRQPQVAIGVLSNMGRTESPDELGKVELRDKASYPDDKRRGHSLVRAWWD